jgi:Protein of unknown function (DUF3223)
LAKPISFGVYNFPTLKACKDDARRRIKPYAVGSILSVDDGEFFKTLFTLHDEYDEKVGSGIRDIEIGLDFHRKKCLFIIRNDNSKVVISWNHCIKPYTKKMVVSYAFRRAVKATVIEYKNKSVLAGAICPISGIKLTFENSHVSYSVISFDDMLSSFLATNSLTYETVGLTDPSFNDSDQRGIIEDQRIVESWLRYHQSNAVFELLSAEANLSKQS